MQGLKESRNHNIYGVKVYRACTRVVCLYHVQLATDTCLQIIRMQQATSFSIDSNKLPSNFFWNLLVRTMKNIKIETIDQNNPILSDVKRKNKFFNYRIKLCDKNFSERPFRGVSRCLHAHISVYSFVPTPET